MLDENLPTFHFKQSESNPLSHVLYFTQNGAEPAPEYVLRRPDPTQPLSRNKYAVALCDPYSPDIVFGEVVVEPEWTQPTLSAAEIRAQQQGGAPPAPATPVVPDSFTVLLYNPDQTINFRLVPGSWNKTDSWEFEMPTQSFRLPSSSELDRAHDNSDLVPKIMFRWKKDGRLGKDMTCYMTGKNQGGRKSKEPDITVALFKAARESAVTVYEPNLHRVEVEDRKGLEVALVLSAEVVRDLWLMPRFDPFNLSGTMPATNGGRRKNSRPSGNPSPTAAMSGALPGIGPSSPVGGPACAAPAAIDAETRRLQAIVQQEEQELRERELREKYERERRTKAEEKRIKKMLEDEEREQRRREAEVAKETERLRRMYGTEGQDLSSAPSNPQLPPRGYGDAPYPHHLSPNPALPPRPVSAGPSSPGQGQPGSRRRDGSGGGLNLQNPVVSRGNPEEGRKKMQKKRSMHW